MLFQGEEWAASTPFQYFTAHAGSETGAPRPRRAAAGVRAARWARARRARSAGRDDLRPLQARLERAGAAAACRAAGVAPRTDRAAPPHAGPAATERRERCARASTRRPAWLIVERGPSQRGLQPCRAEPRLPPAARGHRIDRACGRGFARVGESVVILDAAQFLCDGLSGLNDSKSAPIRAVPCRIFFVERRKSPTASPRRRPNSVLRTGRIRRTSTCPASVAAAALGRAFSSNHIPFGRRSRLACARAQCGSRPAVGTDRVIRRRGGSTWRPS